MNCPCGDVTCSCLFACCCQQDLCSCDLCSAIRETCCSICGLPFHTEGRDACQCFLESRPDTSPAFPSTNRNSQEPKDADTTHVSKDVLTFEKKISVTDERLVNDEQPFLPLDTNQTVISRVEDDCTSKKGQTPEVQEQEITSGAPQSQCSALFEGYEPQILEKRLEGNQDKYRPALHTSYNTPENKSSRREKSFQPEPITHTKDSQDLSLEGKSVKSKECEVMPPEASAEQQMRRTEKLQLNPIPSFAKGESTSNLTPSTDQNRTFSSQKLLGRPFYQNEGFNFQLPHIPMLYTPRPIINFPPMVFLDYSRFHQYSQIIRNTACSLTMNRPPTPDVTPSEKHAFIQNWLEQSNPGAGHGQEQDSPCSSGTTGRSRNFTAGRKIKGRYQPSRKNTTEEGFARRSYTDREFFPRQHVDHSKIHTLTVDEKNSMSMEAAKNTRPVRNRSSTGKGKITHSKKNTSEEGFARRSSTDGEFISRQHVDHSKIHTLTVDEKNSMSMEAAKNTRPVRNRCSTGKGKITHSKNTSEEGFARRSSTDGEFISRKHVDHSSKIHTTVDEKDSMSMEEAKNTRPVKNQASPGKGKITQKETPQVDSETDGKQEPPETPQG